ncbi:MAG: RNA polymerase sigma-70 factor [Ferruginibacter sp.]
MVATPLTNEKDLVLKINAGDQSAFSTLYKFYYPFVSKFVLGYVMSPEIADDITQEIFIKIWENRNTLNEIRCFRAYLFVMVRNYTLNMLKATARKEAGMAEIIRHYQELRIDNSEEILSLEYQQFLDKTLASLPSRSREVFNLCRSQAKNYNEAGLELGISRNAVKNHMVYSMKVLKKSAERAFGISLGVWLSLFFLSY